MRVQCSVLGSDRGDQAIDMIETFELPVACNGDTHRVEIRVDARQRVRCVLHDHDQVVEDVLEALGGPATACSRAEGAVRSLRSQIPSAADRVAWVRLGITAPFLYAGWQSVGVTSPRMAKRWLRVVSASEPAAVGWDAATKVLAWKLNGFTTPTSAGPWARAGCDPSTASQWVAAGQTVASAQEWFDFGVDTPAEVAGWRALGAHLPQETAEWLAAGVCSGTEALLWSKLGVTRPAHVVRWLSAGAIDADDVLLWVRCGLDISGGAGPEAVEDWLQATSSGAVARSWLSAGRHLPGGITRSGVAPWQAVGVHTGGCLGAWLSVGVTRPEEVAAWWEAGVTDVASAAEWARAGVRSLADLERWADVGITSSAEALSWVEPVFITCIEEVGAWRAARYRSPEWARQVVLSDRSQVPDNVVAVRAREKRFLLGGGITPQRGPTDQPGWVPGARLGAHPDAVVSERYFYAFGYPCRAEAATEVVEQDFDAGGTEVSRHYRSWFPDPRDRSVGSAEGGSHA